MVYKIATLIWNGYRCNFVRYDFLSRRKATTAGSFARAGGGCAVARTVSQQEKQGTLGYVVETSHGGAGALGRLIFPGDSYIVAVVCKTTYFDQS